MIILNTTLCAKDFTHSFYKIFYQDKKCHSPLILSRVTLNISTSKPSFFVLRSTLTLQNLVIFLDDVKY